MGQPGAGLCLSYCGLIPTPQSQRHWHSDMDWDPLSLQSLFVLHKPHQVGLGASWDGGTLLVLV